VDVHVKAKLVLDLDSLLNLLLNELLVLLSSDLALGKLVTLDADLLGLREGANGGSGEEREAVSSISFSMNFSYSSAVISPLVNLLRWMRISLV
jgi:hypothetical protein